MKPSNLPKGEHYGFIAQDMEKEFPELVRTDSITKLKAIDYQGLVPVLLQSIKEQQNQINLLQETVNSLLASGKQKESAPLAPGKNTQLSNENVLHQNVPNPFSQNTSISYNLNDSVNSAMISIYDLNGTQIKSYRINQRGSGSITVSANELKSGIYIYSLIVNGCLIDTKRMVLTD